MSLLTFFLLVNLLQCLVSSFALQTYSELSNNNALTSGPKSITGLDFDVIVPAGAGPFPVVILLHGRCRNEAEAMQIISTTVSSNMKRLAQTHIRVVPAASECSWNVLGEPSKRDDTTLIGTELPAYLGSFRNVQATFKLFGWSNGAGLVNRILIENDNAQIIAAVTCASQLNLAQWHDDKFYIGGSENAYDVHKQKLQKRHLLQITGDSDTTVPAAGGSAGSHLPREYVFLPWDESAYHFAQAFGYTGGFQISALQDDEVLARFSYLNGQVRAHNYKGLDHPHLTHDVPAVALNSIEAFLLEAI